MVIKKLYLDPFLDMFNGEILNYSITQTPSAVGILSAQKRAIEITSDCQYRRTFHSDRSWAYQMEAYSSALKENKIFQSMSRKGNCYDNSVMENFFGTFKTECLYRCRPTTGEQVRQLVDEYIHFYNYERIDLKNGLTPYEIRSKTA